MPDVEYMEFCCNDPENPCEFRVRAKTKEEAMEYAKAHAESAHGREVTPEMEKEMKEAMKPVTVKE